MPRYQVTLDGKTFVVEGSRPPTEAEARDALASFQQPAAQEPAAAAEPSLMDRIKDAAYNASPIPTLKFMKDNPVQAAAIMGGMAAAPLTGGGSIPASMAAAGLGAAGGAGLGSIANAAMGGENGPRTAGGVARTMATEGAASAAGQGLGSVAGNMLRLGGRMLYRGVLRPSVPLQREFGDIAAKGLEEGARVSNAGVKKISGRLSANSEKAAQMIADAEAGGAAPVTTREVAGEFGDVFKQGRQQAQLGRPDPRPAVKKRLDTFAAKNPAGIPLTEAQALKREAQDLSSRAYRAADRGGPMTDLSAESDKAMARGLRKGIEARVPKVADVNADTQSLIGVERALEDANMRNLPGVGTLRSMLGSFMPGTTSGAAIGLDRAGRLPLPAALRTALLSMLGASDE